MSDIKKKRVQYEPKILKEFKELGNDHNKLRVRLLQFVYPHSTSDPKLDIRQYLEDIDSNTEPGEKWSGFTRRGVTLGWDDLHELKAIIDEAIDMIDTETAKPEKGKKVG